MFIAIWRERDQPCDYKSYLERDAPSPADPLAAPSKHISVLVYVPSLFLLTGPSSYDRFQLYLSCLISSKIIIWGQKYKEWADGQ